MATSLKISKKEGLNDHLPLNTYHTVQRLWKSVQRILRYFGSKQTSQVQNKIGCHGNMPWDIDKTISDLSSTPKTLSYSIKTAKIARGLCFAYDTKLVVPSEIWKRWTRLRKFTQIPSIWWKDREIWSSRYWDSFAHSKKKKKLRKVKYIARSAGLPCGLN